MQNDQHFKENYKRLVVGEVRGQREINFEPKKTIDTDKLQQLEKIPTTTHRTKGQNQVWQHCSEVDPKPKTKIFLNCREQNSQERANQLTWPWDKYFTKYGITLGRTTVPR